MLTAAARSLRRSLRPPCRAAAAPYLAATHLTTKRSLSGDQLVSCSLPCSRSRLRLGGQLTALDVAREPVCHSQRRGPRGRRALESGIEIGRSRDARPPPPCMCRAISGYCTVKGHAHHHRCKGEGERQLGCRSGSSLLRIRSQSVSRSWNTGDSTYR